MVKKASLEMLIKKKLDRDTRKAKTKEVYVESLGGSVTVTCPTDSGRVEYLEAVKTGSYVDLVEGMVKLVYDNCPILHSDELLKGIEVDYPYDSVKAIFDIDDIAVLSNAINSLYTGKEDELEESDRVDVLKN